LRTSTIQYYCTVLRVEYVRNNLWELQVNRREKRQTTRSFTSDFAEDPSAETIRVGVAVVVIREIAALVAIHFVSAAGTHERRKTAGESFRSFLIS
jgi:hypothetical protein